MKKILLLLLTFLTLPAEAAMQTKVIEYKEGKTVLEGYAAWDDAQKGLRPGVLVFHEWWGHGPNVRRRAEMLAKQGYVAFAVDMYGKGIVAKDHETAGKLAGVQFKDRALMRARAQAGLAEIKKLPGVDPARIAAIGYCFGGTSVLELARMGADVRGVASFHGRLESPTPATQKPKAKILVLQGGDDQGTLGDVPAFLKEMHDSGADWEMDQYGGAVHSFTIAEAGDDPKKGMAYNAQADTRSWRRLLEFLEEIFR